MPLNFWGDLYHRSMMASWPLFAGAAITVFFSLNCLFATLYFLGNDPIANVPPGEPVFLIYFSFQTLSTVGYGNMYPQTHYGNIVAGLEMFTGLVYAAVMTGLIFQRFARSRARFIFSDKALITTHDGQRTLVMRLANARLNLITDATAKLWVLRNETTLEGESYRRFYELPIVRNENPSFILSWTIFHVIDEKSPLHGLNADELARQEIGIILSVNGRDENFAATVTDREIYSVEDIVWDHRFVDIIHEDAPNRIRVDYTRFHQTEPLGAGTYGTTISQTTGE